MRTLVRRLRYALRLAWLGWQIAGNIHKIAVNNHKIAVNNHKIAVNQRWLDAQAADLNALADLEYDVQVTAGEKLIERELGR